MKNKLHLIKASLFMQISRKLLLFLFLISFLLGSAGAYLKLTEAPNNELILEIAIVLTLLFTLLCIIRIVKSNEIPRSLKWIYTILVVLFPTIGGLIYLIREVDR